jgi:hypothetical protein
MGVAPDTFLTLVVLAVTAANFVVTLMVKMEGVKTKLWVTENFVQKGDCQHRIDYGHEKVFAAHKGR